MRLLAFFSVAVLVVSISGEDCPNNDVRHECTHLTCASGFHKECVRTVCTCNPNVAVSCISQDDCNNSPELSSCSREKHCVDNFCRCGGRFGN